MALAAIARAWSFILLGLGPACSPAHIIRVTSALQVLHPGAYLNNSFQLHSLRRPSPPPLRKPPEQRVCNSFCSVVLSLSLSIFICIWCHFSFFPSFPAFFLCLQPSGQWELHNRGLHFINQLWHKHLVHYSDHPLFQSSSRRRHANYYCISRLDKRANYPMRTTISEGLKRTLTLVFLI